MTWVPHIVLVLAASCVVVVGSRRLAVYARKRIRDIVSLAFEKEARDIFHEMRRIACRQTARFVLRHLPRVRAFRDPLVLLDHSLKAVDPLLGGSYCEFGVYKATTINFIASRVRQTIHGFDSFEGLPEAWWYNLQKGSFHLSKLPKVRENVKLFIGWFNQTLPAWAKEHAGPIAFLHMDADLYSSTKTVFDVLGDRIVPGTVIQFDEYFNYPGWQEGEYKAFAEFIESRQVRFEYLGYCDRFEQVAVRIVSVGLPAEN